MNETIEIKGLNKFYGKKQALRDVSLTIGQGMFGLLGRNGAGKTTLMKTLATLLPKKDGEITICGISVEKRKEIRRIIGYLPQEFSVYPSMSVSEAMNYLGILSGLNGRERKERTHSLLNRVNLTEHSHKKVKALSGGMKRRAGIAQAMLNDPYILILDEPTAGLDPRGRDEILEQISALHKEKKMTIILVSHSMEDIARYADRILVMSHGEKMFDAPPKEVFRHYRELEQMGLAAPQITYVVQRLRDQGIPLKEDITTVEEAKAGILELLGKAGGEV